MQERNGLSAGQLSAKPDGLIVRVGGHNQKAHGPVP
jgi:hypothetical protein